VTDVANAVFDGTDALMLSGETAFGQYPVKSVETMARTALNAEQSAQYAAFMEGKAPHPSMSITDSIAFTSVEAARNLKAQAIITATQSGLTARKISRYKPGVPIMAVTTSHRVMNQLTLSYGIIPVQVSHSTQMTSLMDDALHRCEERGLIKTGDLLVITAGMLTEVTGGTNIMRIHVMANVLARGEGIGKGVIKGKVQLATGDRLEPVDDNRIMVVDTLTGEQAEKIRGVKAVITTEPGLTSPTAHHCREEKLPVITGVTDAMSILSDNREITIDLLRGIIYDGIINLPGD
jgi:pyruvate kinase